MSGIVTSSPNSIAGDREMVTADQDDSSPDDKAEAKRASNRASDSGTQPQAGFNAKKPQKANNSPLRAPWERLAHDPTECALETTSSFQRNSARPTEIHAICDKDALSLWICLHKCSQPGFVLSIGSKLAT